MNEIMKKKSTTRERVAIILISVFGFNFMAMYIHNLLQKKPIDILDNINPITWIQFYVKNPMILVVLFAFLCIGALLMWNNSKDFITQHEDDARLATAEEINKAFGHMKVKR